MEDIIVTSDIDKKTYHFEVNTNGNYFWAKCREHEPLMLQDADLKKLETECKEALDFYLKD